MGEDVGSGRRPDFFYTWFVIFLTLFFFALPILDLWVPLPPGLKNIPEAPYHALTPLPCSQRMGILVDGEEEYDGAEWDGGHDGSGPAFTVGKGKGPGCLFRSRCPPPTNPHTPRGCGWRGGME